MPLRTALRVDHLPAPTGWVVVGMATLALAVSAGVRFSFGAAVPSLERHWAPGDVALSVTVNRS